MALFDIRDNGKYAQDFITGVSFDDFKDDPRTFYAVTRALEIISEAARRLPPEIHARHPEFP
ncbi:MAG TPA: HepT-like ribonuclease domain-containing protein [Methylocystis sp.]|nr:HepT-like ribonuclease domain-containing protein [Methylocystis sp.]